MKLDRFSTRTDRVSTGAMASRLPVEPTKEKLHRVGKESHRDFVVGNRVEKC